jgi:hypothetical protein
LEETAGALKFALEIFLCLLLVDVMSRRLTRANKNSCLRYNSALNSPIANVSPMIHKLQQQQHQAIEHIC